MFRARQVEYRESRGDYLQKYHVFRTCLCANVIAKAVAADETKPESLSLSLSFYRSL